MRVWVDGLEFGAEEEVAGAAALSLWNALKAGGRKVKGHWITGTPPSRAGAPSEADPGAEPFTPEAGKAPPPTEEGAEKLKALLRYPPGEGPLYRGSRRWA